jgi:lipopolysaccharide transport system ATP-binding protein
MSNLAISVENLSKSYRIAHQANGARYKTLREDLMQLPKRILSRFQRFSSPLSSSETFWALKDVSFEVKQGEVVGIIGRNGAGKSTLLKILSRITEPTSGQAKVYGRVGSLLEVGTGFHPELTGRENIFLNGAILGMRRTEIRDKFDEIVAFSEIEKFLDTPVKRYSSGMYVRLAFAVAANLDPEILLIDEVLAVGDAEFQKKCLGKMQEVSQGGRTILFVSHNMGAIASLCSRCFWLDHGSLALQGATTTVVNAYLKQGAGVHPEKSWKENDGPGDDTFKLRQVRICQPINIPTGKIDITKPFQIEIESDISRDGKKVGLGLQIVNERGDIVFHTSDILAETRRLTVPGRHLHVCTLPAYALNSGQYFLTIMADEPHIRMLFFCENVLNWIVEPTSERMSRYSSDAWKGVLGPGLGEWDVFSAP